MVDAQTIGVLVTAASVTVAAIYYMFTLSVRMRAHKATLDTRQAQLFMQLFDRFNSSEFTLNYGRARYEILPQLNNSPEELNKFIFKNTNEKFNSEVFLLFHQLSVFFDGVGVLVQKDLINIDLVERLFSDRIIWFWTMIKPRIIFSRESQGPQLYENMEWLYHEMIQRQEKPVAK